MSQKIEKISFRIIGMYCITCKPIVQKQLKDEKAVQRIDINYMTDSVIIEFDSSLITREQIKNRLEKSGYKFVRTGSIIVYGSKYLLQFSTFVYYYYSIVVS